MRRNQTRDDQRVPQGIRGLGRGLSSPSAPLKPATPVGRRHSLELVTVSLIDQVLLRDEDFGADAGGHDPLGRHMGPMRRFAIKIVEDDQVRNRV